MMKFSNVMDGSINIMPESDFTLIYGKEKEGKLKTMQQRDIPRHPCCQPLAFEAIKHAEKGKNYAGLQKHKLSVVLPS